MKVLTWNVNKAGELRRRELWEMVHREDADIVLLQGSHRDSRMDPGALPVPLDIATVL